MIVATARTDTGTTGPLFAQPATTAASPAQGRRITTARPVTPILTSEPSIPMYATVCQVISKMTVSFVSFAMRAV